MNQKSFHKTIGIAASLAVLLTGASLGAQQTASQPAAKIPAAHASPATQSPAVQTAPAARATPATAGQTSPAPQPAPALSPSGHPNNAYWIEHDKQLMVDFGGLNHFKDADAILGPPKPGQNRVVFMGDSITEIWKLDQSFPGRHYVNRGISGQTTPQMLVRFRQDVIDLHPKVVVILGGTNDIAGNTGPMTLEQTEGDLASMAELARANGIHVVLCSILPAADYWWAPGHDPAPKIAEVNAWLKDFAARHGYVYVDYYSVMKNSRGGLPPNLSRDGVHPTPAGFAVMTPLVKAGIAKALKTGSSK